MVDRQERPGSAAQQGTTRSCRPSCAQGGIFSREIPKNKDNSIVKELQEVAAIVGVGWSSLERLVAIQKRRPDLIEALREGKVTLAEASRRAGFIEYDSPIPGSEYANFGRGDQFKESTEPLVRYLRAWRGRDFQFRHVNPKEAKKRVQTIDRLIEGLTAARNDLEGRTVKSQLSH